RGENGSGNAGNGERSLSTGERIAFEQIGERLKKDSGGADEAGKRPEPVPPAGPPETIRPAEDEIAAQSAEAMAAEDNLENAADEELADLIALDGEQSPAAEAEVTDDASVSRQAQAAEPEQAVQPEPPARKAGRRPGLSLLDFAEWDQPEKAAE